MKKVPAKPKQDWRVECVQHAKSQLLIEGMRVTPAAEANIQRYVSGEITVQEALAAATARYKKNVPAFVHAL